MECAVDLFIGKRIVYLRKKRHLSQDDLAAMVGVSRQQIQKYETGATKVAIGMLLSICRAIKVDIDAALEGISDIAPPQESKQEFISDEYNTHLNVLLVEDSSLDERITRKAIEKTELSVHISSVENGQEAMELLRNILQGLSSEPMPNIILLDLKMPKLNGYETLKSLKSNQDLKHIPAIVITNSITITEMNKVYKAGASGYIVKSFCPEHYYDKMRVIMNYWSSMVLPCA